MSIQTTITITRNQAIERIIQVDRFAREKNYLNLDYITHESEEYYSLQEFVDNYNLDISNLEKWTNKMLGDVMDSPFFRKSFFENYWVR